MHRQQSVHTQALTHSARHVRIIIQWVKLIVFALTATYTVISLQTAAMVPVKPQFKPPLIKLYFQPLEANLQLKQRRSMLESALHVVILTTLQTCARTRL